MESVKPKLARRRRPFLAALLAALALTATTAMIRTADADTYKDERLGISLRIPDKFEPVPVEPNENFVLAKFSGPKEIIYGKDAQYYFQSELTVVRIPKTDKGTITINGQEIELTEELRKQIPWLREIKSAKDWITRRFGDQVDFTKEKKVKINDIEAKQLEFDMTATRSGDPIKYLATVFPTDDIDYLVMGGVIENKYKKYAGKFRSAAKSFRIDTAKLEAAVKAEKDARAAEEAATDLEGYDITKSLARAREKKIKWAQESIKPLKKFGWADDASDHYVVLYNCDKSLAREIMEQLEALRAQVFEKKFPPSKPITAVSVVRICADLDDYHAYGGPGGSAGYWNSQKEELVIYDDTERNKANTFATMYHEAFHQYIHYASGELPPHSWFNEGTGDYFAGYKYKGRNFKVDKMDWRTETIRNAVRSGTVVPLKDFLRYEQNQYYETPDICYSQGWALIYFLREVTREPNWQAIPEIYFETLKTEYANALKTGTHEFKAGKDARTKAVDKAFEGIDLDALEKAFHAFCEEV